METKLKSQLKKMKAFRDIIMKIEDKIEDILFGSRSKLITKVITIAAAIYIIGIIIAGVLTKII